MSNIIDKIQVSGVTYDIGGGGGIPESAFTAYTASTDIRISQDEEVTAAALNELNEAVSGKQDTLSAGTNITIVDNVISAEGGGKAIEAGRGISITTGETADTVSFNLPISAGTGTDSIIEGNTINKASGTNSHAEGYNAQASGNYSHAEGNSSLAKGGQSHAEGFGTIASGNSSHAEGQSTTASSQASHTEGLGTTASGSYSHAEGYYTKTTNQSEHTSGQYNVSNKTTTTFGNSGNTLFSVGNGTADNARHNAFEIRQNGDIYLSSGGTDIKLQDHLGGGGSVTVDTELDSGSTNPVQNKVIYNKIDEVEEVTAAGLNTLNDKITPTVELTQAQYDALVDKDPNTYYIITDAQAGDLTNYYTKTETNTLLGGKANTATTYTKTEVDNAITAATSTKQDTLVSGTNIKTINNTSILGSGNIDIQGGGGGKAVSGGTNISITTGETADTINCTLNLENGTNSQSGGLKLKSFVAGNEVRGRDACAFGGANQANGINSFVTGYYNTGNTSGAFVSGNRNKATNGYETLFGLWAISNGSYNDMGGYSDATLLAVGNGEFRTQTKHNAFEIRQNGDIYIADTNDTSTTNWYEKPMIKLQDQLGGSSITVDTALNSGSTNPVENRVIYNKIDEVEQVTARALNELNDAVSGKQDTLVSGTNIKTINNQSLLGSGNIDIQGGGGGTVESAITSGSTNAVESKAIWSATTFNKGVLLTFDGSRRSTNYPEGCGKIKVENIGSYDSGSIYFNNDEGRILGNIYISNNNGNISVDTSRFEGASYEIDGTTVIINYPSTGITSVQMSSSWTCTAVVEGAWMNENTYMNVEVDAIASGLQNNINSKLDATAYTPTVVDSALNVTSTNPVQNQVLYSELRIDNGETETTLAFENRESTNYPNGCTKLIVEVAGSNNDSNIYFYNNDQSLGNISINNWGSILVINTFEGASYEISGTTVIITYPTVTSVTKIRVNSNGNYVFKAIVALATSLKDQVLANTTALGGLKLVKLTEAVYNALATKDSSTLYIIVN